jgi:hypothetical protein
MKESPSAKWAAIALFVVTGIGITSGVASAQSVLDKLKKAAEDASKNGQSKPAAPAQQPKPATPAPAAAPKAATPNAPEKPATPAATATTPASVTGSAAKVETQTLLTLEPGANNAYFLSSHGSHLAAVTSKGSRLVVTYDGVEGPRFDEILLATNSGKMSFSPSGSHYAYIGRSGQEYVVMMDNKEIGRGPQATTTIEQLAFTPGDKHFYYITRSFDGSRSHVYMVLDGKTGPESNDYITPLFSPDGEHHTYILQTHPLTAQPFSTLIVDGKPAAYKASPIAYSGDSMHLFTQAQQVGGMSLLVDGKEFLKAQNARLYTAPVGNAFVTVVSQGTQTQPGGVQFLVIGTQKVMGSDCLGSGGISAIYWSADGKHYAAKCQATQNSYWIMADGKKGLEYTTVSEVSFTAAGKPVYMAQTNNKFYMVTGDEESNGYIGIAQTVINSIFVAPVIGGNHVGFIGIAPQGEMTTVIDNKPIGGTRKAVSDLTLSQDGAHFAFASANGINFDGVDDGTAIVEFQRGIYENGQAIPPGKLLLSPDGKHIFHFGRQAGIDQFGVMIDGKFLAVGRGIPAVATFTPDSKHIFWLDRSEGSNVIVYLDGKPAATFVVNQITALGWWEMGDDGMLTVIAQDGDSMKRFRITPPADSSVDTLLAAAKPLPKK